MLIAIPHVFVSLAFQHSGLSNIAVWATVRLILRFGFAAKKVDEALGRMMAFGLGVVQVIYLTRHKHS